jgi:hypothetical protein
VAFITTLTHHVWQFCDILIRGLKDTFSKLYDTIENEKTRKKHDTAPLIESRAEEGLI